MTDIKITGAQAAREMFKDQASGTKPSGQGFEDVMKEAIGKMSQVQNDAEKAVKELGSGGDVTQAIIAMEHADMSFQLMIEVRNRLLSAYEEVQRMQV